MATSLLFKALSDQKSNHGDDQNLKMKPLCDETKVHEVEKRSIRGKKGPKKQPQRGLGVEKLERLRMQETLMKMNETCSGVVPTFHEHHNFQVFHPFNNVVPVRYGPSNHVQGVFQCPTQKVLNGNSIGPFIGNNNRVCSYENSVPFLSPLVGTTLETSKELSSMPNLHFFEPQCFDFCLNKKSSFNDINVKGSYANYNTLDFLGLVPQSATTNIVGETSDFYNKVTMHDAASATSNVDESVQVIAIHRKGNSRVFIEYEFFKGKDGIDTTSKEQKLATNIDVAEASPIIVAPYEDPASSYIDLSLKLSN